TRSRRSVPRRRSVPGERRGVGRFRTRSNPVSDFERIALANPDILMRMLRLLAQRMRESQEEITRMSLQNVAARLARRILDLCERHGRATEEGIEVDLSLTRQELGSWIGASRETATRLLQQFQREGVLRIEGSRIIVLKPLILQSWSEA